MANDYSPRPGPRFHAWPNSFVTHANAHLGDLRVAPGDQPPTGPSFPSVDMRKPYVVDYPGEGVGKTGLYMEMGGADRQRGTAVRDGECDDRSIAQPWADPILRNYYGPMPASTFGAPAGDT